MSNPVSSTNQSLLSFFFPYFEGANQVPANKFSSAFSIKKDPFSIQSIEWKKGYMQLHPFALLRVVQFQLHFLAIQKYGNVNQNK